MGRLFQLFRLQQIVTGIECESLVYFYIKSGGDRSQVNPAVSTFVLEKLKAPQPSLFQG